MTDVAKLERRLVVIADRLDAIDVERAALFEERLGLWATGQEEHGLNPVHLSRLSRLKAVTVRTLLARHRGE